MKLNSISEMFKVLFGDIPGQLVIQTTNHCKGACPQCGMRKSAAIERCSLTAEIIQKTVNQCAENGFEAVSFTGGEPFVNMDKLFSALDYAGEAKIRYLRTGTNGFMLAPNGKSADIEQITLFTQRLSVTKVRNFWISIDSADTQMHETMRGLPGVVEGIQKALPIFHSYGLYPAANLGINRNISGLLIERLNGLDDEERFLEAFKSGFTAFFQKVIQMGFTIANVCYPMSSNNEEVANFAYGAISADYIVSFSPRELTLVFQALFEVVSVFRDKIRIFTPLSMLYAMASEDETLLLPCLGGIRYFYMDSRDGHIYPCGYRGNEDLGDDLQKAVRQAASSQANCIKCHWECFRDPSQLFGIARSMLRHPIQTFIKNQIDPTIRRLWFEDIKYYIACDFFDGRTAPRQQKTPSRTRVNTHDEIL
jgi:hypothetical protein